jgi:hypothetical protein
MAALETRDELNEQNAGNVREAELVVKRSTFCNFEGEEFPDYA